MYLEYGPIYACISSGYQDLLHVQEGNGDKAISTNLETRYHIHMQLSNICT